MFEIGRLTRLNLGYTGEANSRPIEICVADWLADWPGAAIGLLLRRPGEDTFYPAKTSVENSVMKYTPTRADVELPGDGLAQIVLTDENDVELRSRVVRTCIEPSLPGSEAEAPEEPMRPFVDQVLEAAARAEAAADEAQTAVEYVAEDAERAVAAADNAEAAAKRAEEAAGMIGPGGGGTGTVTSVNGVQPDDAGNVEIDIPEPPTKLGELEDDAEHRLVTDTEKSAWNAKSNFSGEYADLTGKPTIPNVPSWALQSTKPTYTAAEVGALPSTYTPPNQTAAQVGADPAGTAESKVSTHNADEDAHPAIRQLISDLSGRLSALADSDDTTLDQLSEIVAYIKSNKSLIDSITTGKVSTADIVNNLTSTATNKPLSAAQGKALKALIDAIVVPTKLSELAEDATHRVVTDEEKAAWDAKSTFSGAYADLTGKPTKVSAFENDEGYLTEHQDIGHLLPRTELGAAVDVALAEAKASGAFDGEDGKDGKTPVAGVDYYTPEDKSEFTEYIAAELAKRGQLKPEFANSIDDCTDESKLYVLPDGYIYAYMTKEVTTPTQKVPNFTNLMDDPNAYTKKGYRYSQSGGAFKTESTECAIVVPCPTGSVILRVNPYAMGNYPYIYGGTTNQAFPTTVNSSAFSGHSADADGTVAVTFTNNSCSYITFCVGSSLDVSNLIVTANEEITYREEGGTETVTGWMSTGHAFVPADYESRIIGIEDNVDAHNARIVALEEKVENIDTDASKAAAYARIKNWNYPIYENAPVFMLETNKPAVGTSGQFTTSGIYAKYDALMASHSHYITRENCGTASDNATPIYAYHFEAPENRVSGGERKPVFLICSGVHLEWTGIYALYYAMEEITTNPKLHDLYRNVHFVVTPMLNPTAVDDDEYHMRNPDGIQVHTNFEIEHGSNGAVYGDYDYGGETPLSIPETQYFDALMAEYQDDLACVLSCHNNVSDNTRNTAFIWCSCGTKFMYNFGNRFADKMSAAWLEKYGDSFAEAVRWANDYALENFTNGEEQPEWDLRVGWASMSSTGGSEYKHSMKYGAHGINVEVCPRCVLDMDYSATNTANVMSMGAETYINFFRTYMAAWSPMLKQDYAPNLPWAE